MLQVSVSGSTQVGVYARALGECVLFRPGLDADLRTTVAKELDGTPIEVTIGGSGTVGSLAVGNENGVLVSNQATDAELVELRDALSLPVETLPGRINAAGNVIVANDAGAYVHPDLPREAVTQVRETLGVPVERGAIGGVNTVGTAAVANNSGILCHPKASDAELDLLSEHLDCHADIGTVNYGAPLLGAGLVANDNGYVVGSETTGPEMGRIEDALGFID